MSGKSFGIFTVILIIFIYILVSKSFSLRNAKNIIAKKTLRRKRRNEYRDITVRKIALKKAMDRGLNVDSFTIDQIVAMYREERKEEGIKAAIEKLGLTREEAIEQGFVNGPAQVAIEIRCREESEKLGRKITPKDLFEITKESLRKSNYPTSDCIMPWELEDYQEKGEWSVKGRASHLESCVYCASLVEAFRAEPYIPGPDCYTEEDLDQVTRTGNILSGKLGHKDSCEHCKRKLSSAQWIFIHKKIPDQSFHLVDLEVGLEDLED